MELSQNKDLGDNIIMRDMKLYYEKDVGFDIDIIDGYPVYVDDGQTQDQRASVGAIFTKGTLPGHLDIGVSWNRLYSKEDALVDIDNEVKQMVSEVAGGDGTVGNTYLPLYVPNPDGSVNVTVMRGFV